MTDTGLNRNQRRSARPQVVRQNNRATRGRIVLYPKPAAKTPSRPPCVTYSIHHERPFENGNEVGGFWAVLVTADSAADANVMALRTAEIAVALVTTLASVLACSPSAMRSPTALRKVTDDLHKRLRKRVASAEQNADVQDFLRRSFRGNDTGNA